MDCFFKIVICEDDLEFLTKIKNICTMYFNVKEMPIKFYEFNSGEQLLQQLKSPADLYLLDIKMNKINGIQLKDRLSTLYTNIIIVFVSYHKELMKYAFGKNVYGFVEKPIIDQKLRKVLEKVYKELIGKRVIQFRNNVWLRYSEITHISAEDKYCRIYTREVSYLVREKISEIEKKVPDHYFMRIHKSHIINFKYISEINEVVQLENMVTLRISKSRKEELKENYYRYKLNIEQKE